MKIISVKVAESKDMDKLRNNKAALLAFKREKRAALFEAYDIHKGNINYGADDESAEEHSVCLDWYKRLKDLDEAALTRVPRGVHRYLSGELKEQIGIIGEEESSK